MKKQELLEQSPKKLEIENYSRQTIRNYSSALNLFLEYVNENKIKKVTDKEITDYLFFCKKEKKYSY